MSLPALRESRRLLPNSHITVAARPGTADIFIDADFVDDVLISPSGFLATVRQLRAGRFDLSILLQNAFGAALIAFTARVPIRIGYGTDRRGALLTTSLPVPAWKSERHESFYYLNIVAELERQLFGSSRIADAQPRFDLAVSERRKLDAHQFLIQNGAQVGKPLAILCPGSVNSRAKRWPAERYSELSDRLIESGMNVALIGSSGEVQVSEEVCRRAKIQPILLTGKTSVAEAVALISIADLLVTNDTGPAHIGGALNTPTLVIFGPTNPLTTYPFSDNAKMIRRPPDCAPCMLRDCPIDHRCMTAIAPQEVFESAVAMIEKQTTQIFG